MTKKHALEVEKNGFKFQFVCDSDAPLTSAHDALLHLKGDMVERLNEGHRKDVEATEQYNAAAKAQAESEAEKEDSSEAVIINPDSVVELQEKPEESEEQKAS